MILDFRKTLCMLAFASLWIFVTASAQVMPIEVDEDVAQDEDISNRISTIFQEIEGLDQLGVSVTAGVVELMGTVQDASLQDQAVSIAERTEGIVAVQDHIEVSNELQPRLENAIVDGTSRLVEGFSYLPLLAVAVGILFLFGLLARFVWARDQLFSRYVKNIFIRNLMRQLAGVVVLVIGILVALELLDATAIVGAVLGAAGVVGLAVGFAFRDTIENYIAGILLSLRQPFAPHDHVAVEGYEGHVARLTSRATVLVTFDGNYVRIPNAKVFQGVLVNYSRNPLRRFEFKVGIGTDVDIAAAQQLARETLNDMNGVIEDPPPEAIVDELGDSNVVIIIRGWVNQRDVSFSKVRSEAIRQIKSRFEAEEFDMPEPIYRLRISSGSSNPAIELPQNEANNSSPETKSTAPLTATITEEADLSPDDHMIERVDEERHRVSGEDLLDAEAPQE